MSSSKGSKRISVFDRLGPGNDDASNAGHRRSTGASDKSRHAYGPPPPPHMREETLPNRKSSHSAEYEDKHSSTHYREGGGSGAGSQQARARHRPTSDYPPPGDSEEEGGRRGAPLSGGGPGVPSRKLPRDSSTADGHKLDRVGSGGGSSTPKVPHGPVRPSSSGKLKPGSLENNGGSGSEGDNRAVEEEGKGARSHAHRGDQEAPSKRSSRPSSEGDDGLNSSGTGAGRRLSSKHLERKEKFHGPQPSLTPPPPLERPSSGSTSTRPAAESPHPSTAMTSSSSVGTSGVAPGGEVLGSGAGGKGGRGGRKDSGSQHEHKRRKEEETSGGVDTREHSSSTTSSSRKRKRDQVDDEPPAIEAKKFRTGEQHHLSSVVAKDSERSMRSSREGGASGAGVGALEGAEARSSGDRKRRHDSSTKEGQPRKQHVRSRSPETPRPSGPGGSSGSTSGTTAASSSSNRRHERHSSGGRTITSPTTKKGEHHHRSSKAPSSSSSSKKTDGSASATTAGHESNDDNDSVVTGTSNTTMAASANEVVTPVESVRKKLDWAAVSNYTRKASTKLEKRLSSALERFSPGAVFAHIGVSPALAGKDYFDAISSHVSRHLKKAYQQKTVGDAGGEESSNALPKPLLDAPFEGQQFASSCVSRIKDQVESERMVVDNIGPCRRALTASADYTIRRKLKKSNQEFLPPSQPASNWDSEHYATAVNLYQSMGKKPSGKPAFRVQESQVGTLLVAR